MGRFLIVNKQESHGFTIVELIVVIVIIAILAALTLVTYRGVKTHSDNSRTLANIQSYYNAINLYKIRTGSYPKAPGEDPSNSVAMVCLGTGYKNGQCGVVTNKNIYESSSFLNDLQAGSGTDIAGVINSQYGKVSNEEFTGAVYGIDITTTQHSPTGRARMIEWFLAGKDQDCKIPKAWAYASDGGNTACELDLEPY